MSPEQYLRGPAAPDFDLALRSLLGGETPISVRTEAHAIPFREQTSNAAGISNR